MQSGIYRPVKMRSLGYMTSCQREGDENWESVVGTASRRTKMTDRKANIADERPVLTEMKINRRSILSVLDDGHVEQCRHII